MCAKQFQSCMILTASGKWQSFQAGTYDVIPTITTNKLSGNSVITGYTISMPNQINIVVEKISFETLCNSKFIV